MRLKRAFAAFSMGVFLLVMVFSHSLPPFPRVTEMLRLSPELNMGSFHLNFGGSVLNLSASQVSWEEDLSFKEPPVCDGSGPFVLAMVNSAVANFERRARIRRTWANQNFFESAGLKAVFVVGSAGNNETLMDALDDETDRHEDVIQADILESHRNLTYKTVAWLSWAKTFCPIAPFIVKVDDDVMVNPFSLRLYLQEYLANNPSSRYIHGRAKLRQYSTSAVIKEYPGSAIVLGAAYIVDRNAVEGLLEALPFVPLLWHEDVVLTESLAKKVGIQLLQVERKLFATKLSRKLYYGLSVFLTDVKASDWEKGWKGIVRYSKRLIKKLEGGK